MTEAQQNFVQYAERMQKAGKIEHAFAALKEFTDISPESERLREILSDHLKMYGANPRASSAKINVPTATRPDGEDISKSGKRKTSSLVFLDLGEPTPSKTAKPGPGGRPAPAPPPPPPVAQLLDGGVELKPEPPRASPPPPPRAQPPRPQPPAPKAPLPKHAPLKMPAAKPPQPVKVKPVVPKRPSAPAAAPPSPVKRKTVVEVPPLELEPDFETATTDASHDIDDRPLIEESREHSEFVQTEEDTSISLGGRKSGFINLGIDGIVNQADQSGSLVFSGIEETP